MTLPHYRQVVRRLLRTPAFTLVALLTLAIGVGANTAVFSVVRGVLLKPLPYPEPDRLVGLWHEAPALGFESVNHSPAIYFIERDQGTVFEDVGLWDNGQVSITELQEPEEIGAMWVTDGTLPILGARVHAGRLFSKADDQPDAPPTVMLSYGYWQSRFGGEPAAVGRLLKVDGEAHEIIGVLPRDFRVLDFDSQIFLPFQFDRAETRMGNFSYQGLARLKPGVNLDAVDREVDRLIPIAAQTFPGGLSLDNLKEARFAANTRMLSEDVVGDIGNALWVLMGTVGLVLLIACANVANLFLVRAEGRYVELAVRRAMGADGKAIAWQHLSESLTLSLAGGVVGLGFAELGLRLLRAIGPEGLPRLHEISIDAQVTAVALGLSLLAGLVLGLGPALRRAGASLSLALREGGRGGSTGKGGLRVRNGLVVCQIALALVLLIGAGLLLRSFDALRSVEPGFSDPEQVLTLRLSLPSAQVPEPERVIQGFRELSERLGAVPGITSVGLTSSAPMDGRDSNDTLYVEGFPTPEGQLPPIRRFKWIAEGYFQTIGNPLLAGRSITWQDVTSQTPVAVVSAGFASEYWSTPQDALGKRVRQASDSPWREIVGVVGDVHDDGMDQAAVPLVFWPMAQRDFWQEDLDVRRSMVFALRSERPVGSDLVSDVEQAVWSVNRNLPLANVRSLKDIQDRSMARTSFIMVMLGIASTVALLLGFVGIFSVSSYAASQRTREFGVRFALGAQRAHVRRLLLTQSLTLGLLGIALGIGGAVLLTRSMASLLYGVSTVDPLTYGLVAAFLLSVSLVAAYLPAARAARVNPIEALRCD